LIQGWFPGLEIPFLVKIRGHPNCKHGPNCMCVLVMSHYMGGAPLAMSSSSLEAQVHELYQKISCFRTWESFSRELVHTRQNNELLANIQASCNGVSVKLGTYFGNLCKTGLSVVRGNSQIKLVVKLVPKGFIADCGPMTVMVSQFVSQIVQRHLLKEGPIQ